MFPLGVLNKKSTWQTVLDLPFNADFLDTTGRHSVVSASNVSLAGGEVVGNSFANLRYGGNLSDFSFVGDLILEARFKFPPVLTGRYLMSFPRVDDNWDGLGFSAYLTSESTPRLSFYFGPLVGYISIPTSTYLPVANTYVTLRLEKVNNRIAVFLNGNNAEGQQVGSITSTAVTNLNLGTNKLFQLFGETTINTNDGTCDFVRLQRKVG